MTSSDYSKSLIALACWRAAQTDLPMVMLAVCMVFRNRAEAGETDLYEVATRWLAENPGNFPDLRDPKFLQLLSNLDSVTSGMVADKTGGALWFIPTDQLKPDMLTAFSITTTIGGLSFVK